MTWDSVRVIADEKSNVSKYIFEKPGCVVESVLYKYPDFQTRTVICCSTQSGCPIGCRFCGSGDYFVRSLAADEIVAQAVRCVDDTGVDPATMGRLQIMFMSMGEPMLTMRALGPAIRELHRLYPKAALLISTSGPRVDYQSVIEVSVEVPTVGLQFSVHESTDAARDALIPFKAKLNLQEIAEQGLRWRAATGRKPFFNYCAHDRNSSPEDADRILALFDPRYWCATVSVICEQQEWLPSTNEHQRNLASDFASKLVERGYDTRMFDPAGQDTIGGGCGQLWFVQEWMREHPEHAKPSIGRGKAKVHVPIVALAS
jgi:23S rRNA (adenine2503-C2)-methyltransferase